MSITLETLTLEFNADFSQFENAANNIDNFTDKLGAKIENKFNSTKISTKSLDNYGKSIDSVGIKLNNLHQAQVKYNAAASKTPNVRAPRVANVRTPRVPNVRAPRVPNVKAPNVRVGSIKAPTPDYDKASIAKGERDYNAGLKRIADKFKNLQNLLGQQLGFNVNHKELTRLNKHLSLKQKHFKETKKDLEQEVKPRIKDLGTKNRNRPNASRRDQQAYDGFEKKAKAALGIDQLMAVFSDFQSATVDLLNTKSNQGIAASKDGAKVVLDTEIFKETAREKLMAKEVTKRQNKAAFDPIDRKQLMTDELSRIKTIENLPVEGFFRGFFENFGRTLSDYSMKTVSNIGFDATGKRVGDEFEKNMRKVVQTVGEIALGKDLNVFPAEQQNTKALSAAVTSEIDLTKAIVSLTKEISDLKTLTAAKEKPRNITGQVEKVALHRQDVSSAKGIGVNQADLAFKQAQASTAFFKGIYADFKTAQAEYKRVEKLLLKFQPGADIPPELATRAAKAATKLKEVSNSLNAAGKFAKTDIEKAKSFNPSESAAATLKSQKGYVGRFTKKGVQDSLLANTRMSKHPQIKLELEGISQSKTKGIAKDTVDGLNNSLSSLEPKVKDQGKSLGKNLEKGTKDSLDIHSPSRVYKQIGKFVNEGLQLGADPKKANELGKDIGDSLKKGTEDSLKDATFKDYKKLIKQQVKHESAKVYQRKQKQDPRVAKVAKFLGHDKQELPPSVDFKQVAINSAKVAIKDRLNGVKKVKKVKKPFDKSNIKFHERTPILDTNQMIRQQMNHQIEMLYKKLQQQNKVIGIAAKILGHTNKKVTPSVSLQQVAGFTARSAAKGLKNKLTGVKPAPKPARKEKPTIFDYKQLMMQQIEHETSKQFQAIQSKSKVARLGAKMLGKGQTGVSPAVDMKQVAYHTIEGLAKGLKLDKVVNKGTAIGDALIKSTRKALGIHSPSREFLEIGVYIMEGLIKGLNKGNDPTGELRVKMMKDLHQLKAEIKAIDFAPEGVKPLQGNAAVLPPKPKKPQPLTGNAAILPPKPKIGKLALRQSSEIVKGNNAIVKASQESNAIERARLQRETNPDKDKVKPDNSAAYKAAAAAAAFKNFRDSQQAKTPEGRKASAEAAGKKAADNARAAGERVTGKTNVGAPGANAESDAKNKALFDRIITFLKVNHAKGKAADKIREAKEDIPSKDKKFVTRESLSRDIDKNQELINSVVDQIPAQLGKAFHSLPPKIKRQILRVQREIENGAIPDASHLPRNERKRGHQLLTAEYDSYATGLRRNIRVGAKNNDPAIKKYKPELETAIADLLGSKTSSQDIESLKEIKRLTGLIRVEQKALNAEYQKKLGASAFTSIKAQALDSLDKLQADQGISPERLKKIASIRKAVDIPGAVDPRVIKELQDFFKQVGVTKSQLQTTMNNLKAQASTGKISESTLIEIVETFRSLGKTDSQIKDIMKGIKKGKSNKEEFNKAVAQTHENLKGEVLKASTTSAKAIVGAFMVEFKAAIEKEAKSEKIKAPINGLLDLPGSNSALLDRANNNARAQAAKREAREAKTSLERRRARNKARRAQQRAEKGLGTEGDYDRAFARGGNKIGTKAQEFMGIEDVQPGFVQEAMNMILPTALVGSSLAGMATPLITSLIPAVIPLLPSIIAGLSLSKLIQPIIGTAEESLLQTQPIKQRLGLVGDTELGLGGQGELDFVKQTASTYGIDLETAAEEYSKLALAARRTRLEGEPIRGIFEGIAASLGAQQTPAADASLVMNAYSQMVSKGTVSMEELRSQLGEKFPLAMGIFADAMGVSIPALIKLVSSGSLLAEDVLPKVGEALKREFGESAKNATGNIVGLLNTVNSAKFEFAENFGKAFGLLPMMIRKGQAGAIQAINENFQLFSNALMTGIATMVATMAIAVNMIFTMPPVATQSTKIANFARKAFIGGISSVAPFAIIAFADVFDDIFDLGLNPSGKQALFANNLIDAVTGIAVSLRNGLKGALNLGVDDFITNEDIVPEILDRTKDALVGLLPFSNAIKESFGEVTSGILPLVSQLGILYVMLQQMTALSGTFLLKQGQGLIKVLGTYAVGMKRAVLSAGGLVNIWNNANVATGGLWSKDLTKVQNGFRLATIGADGFKKGVTGAFSAGFKVLNAFKGELLTLGAAYVALALSKSTFQSQIVKDLDESVSKVKRSTDDLAAAMESLRNAGDIEINVETKVRPFNAKGYANNLGFQFDPLKLTGKDGYTSDQREFDGRDRRREQADIRENGNFLQRSSTFLPGVSEGITNDSSYTQAYVKAVRDYEDVLQSVGIDSAEFFDKQTKDITIVEKEFLGLAQGLRAYSKANDERYLEGLGVDNLTNDTLPEEVKNSQLALRELNAEIKALEDKRVEVGLLDTDASKVQLGEIDEELRAKFKKKTEVQLEIGFIGAEVKATEKELEGLIKALEANTAFPFEVKQPLLKAYNSELERTRENVKAFDNSQLAKDLAPQLSPWQRLNAELAETVRLYEVSSSKAKIASTNAQAAAIAGLLNAGTGNRSIDTERKATATATLENTQKQLEASNTLLKERQLKLRQLLTVTDTETKDKMKQTIDGLKKSIRADEEKVASLQLNINKQRLQILKAEERIEAARLKRSKSDAERGIFKELGNIKRDSLDTSIDTANEKLRRTILDMDSSLVGAADGLVKSTLNLAAYTEQQDIQLKTMSNEFSQDKKDWLKKLLGNPEGTFEEIVRNITPEEVKNLQTSSVDATRSDVSLRETLKQVNDYSTLVNKTKALQATVVQQQTKLIADLKAATKAMDEFNKELDSRLKDALNNLKNIKLDLLGKEIQNSILSQLKPGTEGVFKDFGGFLSSLTETLIGDEKQGLSLSEQSSKNAEELAKLREKYTDLVTRLNDANKALSSFFLSAKHFDIITNNATAKLNGFAAALTEATTAVKEGKKAPIKEEIKEAVTGSKDSTKVTIDPQIEINKAAEARKAERVKIQQSIKQIDSTRKSLSSKSISISDLARGKGYDPSRFEGSLPNVTPVNNEENWKQIHQTFIQGKESLRSQLTELTNGGTSSIVTNPDGKEVLTNAKIDRLESILTETVAVEQQLRIETLSGDLLNARDEVASTLRGLDESLLGFKDSLLNSQDSINDLANNYGIGNIFETENSGLSDAEKEIKAAQTELRTLKQSLFDQLGIQSEGDILKQDLSADDINNIDVGSTDLSKLSGFAQFAPVIQQYQDGLISFSEAVVQLSDGIDTTSNKLVEATAAILSSENFAKMIEKREERGSFLSRKASQASSSPFKTRLDGMKATKKAELFQNDTDRLKELKAVQDSFNLGTISMSEYKAQVGEVNDFFREQGRIIKVNNSLVLDAKNALESSFEGFLTGIGEAIVNNNGNEKQKAEADELIAYADKLQGLKDKFALDPDLFLKAKENLDIVNESKLDKIQGEFSTFGRVLDLAKEGLKSFVSSMLASVAKIAAQKLAVTLLGSVFGGGGGGGLGGLVSGAISGFSQGGTVGGNSGSMTQGGQIGRAIAKEGKNAQVIVAHKGEEILSTRNGDAQFMRALKKSGDWDRMKDNTPVGNYSNGGTVGAGSYATALSKSSKNSRPSVNNYSSNVSYTLVGNSNQLRQSVSQIEADRQMKQRREYDRNR